MKRWRVNSGAFQLDISRIFYAGKQMHLKSRNVRDTWSNRQPSINNIYTRKVKRHENKRLLKILYRVLLHKSQQRHFESSSSVLSSEKSGCFVSFIPEEIVLQTLHTLTFVLAVVSGTSYKLSQQQQFNRPANPW